MKIILALYSLSTVLSVNASEGDSGSFTHSQDFHMPELFLPPESPRHNYSEQGSRRHSLEFYMPEFSPLGSPRNQDQQDQGLNFDEDQLESHGGLAPSEHSESDSSEKEEMPQNQSPKKESHGGPEKPDPDEDQQDQGLNFDEDRSRSSSYSASCEQSEEKIPQIQPQKDAQEGIAIIGREDIEEHFDGFELTVVEEYNPSDIFLKYHTELETLLGKIPGLFQGLKAFFQNPELGDKAIRLRREKALEIFNSLQNEPPQTGKDNPLKIPDYAHIFTTQITVLNDALGSLSSQICSVLALSKGLKKENALTVLLNGTQKKITDLFASEILSFQNKYISLSDLKEIVQICREFSKDLQACFEKRYAQVLKEEANLYSALEVFKTPEYEKWSKSLGYLGSYLLHHKEERDLRDLSFPLFRDYFQTIEDDNVLKNFTAQEQQGWMLFWILNHHKNLNWLKAPGEKEVIFKGLELIKKTCLSWFEKEKELSEKIVKLTKATALIKELEKERQENLKLIEGNSHLLQAKKNALETLEGKLQALPKKLKDLNKKTVTEKLETVTERLGENFDLLTSTLNKDAVNSLDWDLTSQKRKPKGFQSAVTESQNNLSILKVQKKKLESALENLQTKDFLLKSIEEISRKNEELSKRNKQIEALITSTQKDCPDTAQDLKNTGQSILGEIENSQKLLDVFNEHSRLEIGWGALGEIDSIVYGLNSMLQEEKEKEEIKRRREEKEKKIQEEKEKLAEQVEKIINELIGGKEIEDIEDEKEKNLAKRVEETIAQLPKIEKIAQEDDESEEEWKKRIQRTVLLLISPDESDENGENFPKKTQDEKTPSQILIEFRGSYKYLKPEHPPLRELLKKLDNSQNKTLKTTNSSKEEEMGGYFKQAFRKIDKIISPKKDSLVKKIGNTLMGNSDWNPFQGSPQNPEEDGSVFEIKKVEVLPQKKKEEPNQPPVKGEPSADMKNLIDINN